MLNHGNGCTGRLVIYTHTSQVEHWKTGIILLFHLLMGLNPEKWAFKVGFSQ